MGRGAEGRGKRRGAGFRQAARGLGSGLSDAAARRGFAEPEVLLRWEEIVGADLAPRCRPLKVSYGSGAGLGATLIVAADGARAPEIEHSAPAILARVNQYYGYRAVSRLRIRQEGAGGFAEDQVAFGGAPGSEAYRTSDAAMLDAAALARPLKSPRLRAIMTRLGALVLSRAPGGPSSSQK